MKRHLISRNSHLKIKIFVMWSKLGKTFYLERYPKEITPKDPKPFWYATEKDILK